MESKLLDNVSRSMNVELPVLDNMDDYLDFVIPLIKPWGEDLAEQKFYLDKRWKEIRDEEDFHESVLHIFQEEGEYLISNDGNIAKAAWNLLDESNTIILERIAGGSVITSELFDLAFLNNDFFILKKHGDQRRKGQRKYFFLAREGHVRGLEWRETIELLFNNYRSNGQFIVWAVVILVVVALIILFSML